MNEQTDKPSAGLTQIEKTTNRDIAFDTIRWALERLTELGRAIDRREEILRLIHSDLEKQKAASAAAQMRLSELEKELAEARGALESAQSRQPNPTPDLQASAVEKEKSLRGEFSKVAQLERPKTPEGVGAPAQQAAPETEPKSEPAFSLRSTLLAAAAVAAVLGPAFAWLHGIQARIHRFYPLPYANILALSFHEGEIYTLTPKQNSLLAFAAEGKELVTRSIRELPNPSPGGLALGLGSVWSSNPEGLIYRHEPSDSLKVVESFGNPRLRPEALHWDGRSLWAVEARSQEIFEFNVDHGISLKARYPLPGLDLAGLHVADNLLWVLDRPQKKIFRYRLGRPLVPVDSLDIEPWLKTESRVTGFAVEGGRVWVAVENPSGLHGFDWELLFNIPRELRPWAARLFGLDWNFTLFFFDKVV